MNYLKRVGYLGIFIFLVSCIQSKNEKESSKKAIEVNDIQNSLRSALSFYASFDRGVHADFAKGDPDLYTTMNRREPDSAKRGLHKDSVSHSLDQGKTGGALSFSGKTKGSIFFKSKGNIPYDTINWNGAISFWLKLNPDRDLRPGYCDPIQITDVSYNDASIWVDFTKTLPRTFRLGVIEDREAWNPNPEGPDNEDPKFLDLLVAMENHPFNDDQWTHVLINYSGLNSKNGYAELYVNGQLVGRRTQISNPFTWDLEQSNIYLGLSYIGLFDELALFKRSLTENEIDALYKDKERLLN